MPARLEVLSINFPFKASWVAQGPTLATTRALFDFDVVVIRPYLLVGTRPAGRSTIESGDYSRAHKEVHGKVEDINRLLQQGGLLVVILDEVQDLKFNTGAHSYTGGTIYTVTNYDFLDEHFFNCVRNGTGSRFEIVNAAEPFSAVLKGSSVQWTAFIGDQPPYPFTDTTFFARNSAGSFIGGQIAAGTGNIVFLPNFKELNEEEFFEACREYRYKREGTPAPDWADRVYLPGALNADSRITEIDERMSEIEEERRDAVRERDQLLAYKKLLYEKGRTLEPTVLRTLDQLGFATKPGETISGTGFEIDGRTTIGSTPGILEVKGSKKQIALDEFSPFIPKILGDLEATGYASKGILIGNGLCEAPPETRLGENVFSPHVLEAATRQSVALINAVELYCILCGVLSGNITNLEAIREAILTTNGFVSLRQFCRGFPFPNT
jgi:hypothetical protein